MKTVRFLSTETQRRNGGRAFEQGRAYELDDSTAKHWIARGRAIEELGAKDAEPAPPSGATFEPERPTPAASEETAPAETIEPTSGAEAPAPEPTSTPAPNPTRRRGGSSR